MMHSQLWFPQANLPLGSTQRRPLDTAATQQSAGVPVRTVAQKPKLIKAASSTKSIKASSTKSIKAVQGPTLK